MDFLSAISNKSFMVVTYLILGIFISCSHTITGAGAIGVCNGGIADNLPNEQEVVDLYTSNGIGKMRIYDPNQATLQALRGTNIELILGVPNGDLQSVATASAANDWVQKNVVAFSPDVRFRYIAVGNEVKPTDAAAQFVLPAMMNIYNALVSAKLDGQMKVSTSVDTTLLGNSYPPSAGSFSASASSYITPIINFLASTGAPLLANIYTYFAYISDPKTIDPSYALFTAQGTVVQDGALGYQNLFDATLDAFYSAVEAAEGANVEIVVSESGWPSAGETAATVDNASTYYKNLVDHVNKGTPKRPGKPIETYLFAMFDENQKGPAETERHFGLFSPNKQPKYKISFSAPSIGVCNGRIADDLPSEQDVVNFYKINGIGAMRIYDPNQFTLQALKGTNIQLILGIPNAALQSLTDPSAASDFVKRNIVSFSPAVKFRYISVGNEVKPTDPEAQFVLPAMRNIYNALVSANLKGQIKVSTSVEPTLLGNSYPPSAGLFSEAARPYIIPIIKFLASNGSPLLANIYTYFSYIGDTKNIDLGFALFTSPGVVVQDGPSGYQNLFDATLDSLYSALEKIGAANLEIVVSESGWPSAGGTAATVENASTYYKNLIKHVKNGTPKRPGKPIETYLFAMFDENQKGPAETERHFGLFSPNKQPKYPIKFV
ncbi:hypothetical protein QUC31_019278 [Theobroma cacao]